MIFDIIRMLQKFPAGSSEEQFKIATKQYCSGNRAEVISLLYKMRSPHLFVNWKISPHEILSVFEICMRSKEIWWLKIERDSMPTTKIKYICMVVLLESINYWCWYNHNYSSDFDEKTLREVLQRPLLINEDFYLSEF